MIQSMIQAKSTKHWRRLAMASAGTLLLCGTAHASTTFPPRKPGFWETSMVMKMTMTMNGQTSSSNDPTPMITALCSSAATDAQSEKMMTGGVCKGLDIEQSGNVYTLSGTCADPLGGPNAVATMHGTITMQGDEAFHMVSQISGPNMSGTTVGDSRWLGACPAGIVPGDFGAYQNGTFTKHGNLLQMPVQPPAQ